MSQLSDPITQPRLSPVGWLRWAWRQLTSMRTAILLLLMLAIAAVPGSLYPQRTSDPNGVIQYFQNNPDAAAVLDSLGMFDVYSSVWFTAIYILLFISLIGCVLPRTKHHASELRQPPPATPARLDRLPVFQERSVSQGSGHLILEAAANRLRRMRYRVRVFDGSVAAERGYSKESGNLTFHVSLVGVLIAVAIGGMFGYNGQRVIVEGQTFVNTQAAYDSYTPGRLSQNAALDPYSLRLDDMDVVYEAENPNAVGTPVDFTASVTITQPDGAESDGVVKVNDPLRTNDTDVYLMGNGYAPTVTVRDPSGTVVFRDSIPFLPQDANLTSLGVIKIPDGLADQVGIIAFLYPTQSELSSGAYTSIHPETMFPVMTLTVYSGDLGVDAGVPQSVYELETDDMTLLAGRNADTPAPELMPGQTIQLPNGLGTLTFDDARGENASTSDYLGSILRFASFDIHSDPSAGWVLLFTLIAIAGLLVSFSVNRRRVWVKVIDGRVQVAGLAKTRDARLEGDVQALADDLANVSQQPLTHEK